MLASGVGALTSKGWLPRCTVTPLANSTTAKTTSTELLVAHDGQLIQRAKATVVASSSCPDTAPQDGAAVSTRAVNTSMLREGSTASGRTARVEMVASKRRAVP